MDLSAYAGQTVQVVLAVGADSFTHRTGWYVDNFAVTIDSSTTVEDFEANDGGFSIVTTDTPNDIAYGWSYDVPSKGPAHGVPMWGTHPSGGYGDDECAWIESAPFVVGPVEGAPTGALAAQLRWTQWLDTSSFSAGGLVQFGLANGSYVNIEPDGGYWDSSYDSDMKPCLDDAPAIMTGSHLGTDLIEMTADVSEFVGQEVTLRFLFASDASSSFLDGWYIGSASVETMARVTAPDPAELTGGDPPGWTSGGPVNSWAYGVATDGPEGDTTYKTNLGGSHDANECSYIESSAVPVAALNGATLTFDHWYRIPGASVNVPWAAAVVLVSADDGATWQHVAMDDYTRPVRDAPSFTETYDDCLAQFGADATGDAYGGAKDSWDVSSVDLSSYATGASLKVRFAFGSDGTFAYEGWAIRAVDLGGVKLL